MRVLYAFTLLLCLFTGAARAEDKDIVVIGWLDHFTYGILNTAAGATYGGAGAIYNRTLDRDNSDPVKIGIDETGQQIVFIGGGLNPVDHSVGAFHLATTGPAYANAHEAGHSKESTLLGPTYLLVVGADYLFNEGGYLVENWADANKNLGETMLNDQTFEARSSLVDRNGKKQFTLGFDTNLLERHAKVPLSNYWDDASWVRTRYRYGNLRLAVRQHLNNPPDCLRDNIPIELGGSLLKRDFMLNWTLVDHALKLVLDGDSETAGFSIDLEHKRVDGVLLDQNVGFGARLGNARKISLDVIGRLHGSVRGTWDYGTTTTTSIDPGLMLVGGVKGESRLTLLDSAELYAKAEKDWGSSGYTRSRYSLGATTRLNFKEDDFTHGGEDMTTCVPPGTTMPSDATYDYTSDCSKGSTYSGSVQPRRSARTYVGVEHSREIETQIDSSGNARHLNIKATMFYLGTRWKSF